MKNIYQNYVNTFKGLSKEIWWLALITLINRAGTMVVPFLSLYLTESLEFTKENVGWIMSCFGIGSALGSWLGGELTEKYGSYKVMLTSLALTGVLFVLLQYVQTFSGFCIAIVILMTVADTFRPAMFVALSSYSKPENKTRSVTLIRLAINLGFTAGPAIGGIIITRLGYQGLFWVDGITCVLAVVLMLNVLHPKKVKVLDVQEVEHPVSIFSDRIFWVFFIGMFIFGLLFLQYFSTMPLYYRNDYHLTELQIGLLLGLNGFIIFVLEMPLIKWLEDSKYTKELLIFIGVLLTGISFVVLNLMSWIGILVIGMLFMTVGEMIAFPFSNAFVLERAKKGKQGKFMAFYSLSFSLAHIFSHNIGMHLVEDIGFTNTWNIMIGIAFIGVICFFILMQMVQKEKNRTLICPK